MLLALSHTYTQAQPFGNEWIDHNRVYFKIRVTEEGFYRLNFTQLNQALSQAGLSISQIPRRTFQIHYRGREQALYLPGQPTQPLGPTDFIEFYARKNDAGQDSLLYYNANALVNPYYAIHSDTAVYFLSVNPNPLAQGKRIGTPPLNANFSAPQSTTVIEERIRLFTSQNVRGAQYPFFGGSIKPRRTLWEMGEGWYGEPIVSGGSSGLFSFDSLFGFNASAPALVSTLNVAIVGESGNISYGFDVLVGPTANPSDQRVAGSGVINSYDKRILTINLQSADVSATGQLFVRVLNKTPGSTIRLSWARLQYHALTTGQSLSNRWIALAPQSGPPFETQLILNNFPQQPILFEEAGNDSLVIRPVSVASAQLRVIIPENTSGKRLWLRSGSDFKTPSSLELVRIRDFSLFTPDYLIITHPVYRQQVQGLGDPVTAYASYRTSLNGGSFDTLVVHVAELLDAFAFGEYNPVAIMKGLKYFHRQKSLNYVLFIGKGYGLIPRSDTFALGRNYVPTVGIPGGDQVFGMNVSGINTDSMELAIGRIPAINSQEVANYLQKVIEHEGRPVLQSWHKNLLHLSGGNNTNEIQAFNQYMKAYELKAIDTMLGARVRSRTKQSTLNVEFINIAEQINAGQLMVNIFAHSSISFIDIDVGDVNNPINGYNNAGKYPFFMISGCNSGSVYGGQRSWGEPWVLSPGKGAIAFLAHADLGYSFSSDQYNRVFYDSAFVSGSLFGASIGDLVKAAGNRILQFTDPATIEGGTYAFYRAHAEQTILQGDPAIKLFPVKKPDFTFSGSGPTLNAFDGGSVTAGKDSLQLFIPLQNWGRAVPDSLQIEVSRNLQGQGFSEVIRVTTKRLLREDTLVLTLVQERNVWAGVNQFRITLDPDQSVDEHDETNNVSLLTLAIPAGGAVPLQPTEFSFSGQSTQRLVAVSGSGLLTDEDFYFEWDTTASFQSASRRDTTVRSRGIATWQVDLSQFTSANDTLLVFWRVKLLNAPSGVDTSFVQSSFAYMAGTQQGWSQRGLSQLTKNGLEQLKRDPLSSTIDFAGVETEVEFRVAGAAVPSGLDSIKVSVNRDLIIPSGVAPNGPCTSNSLLLMAFDRNNALPYQSFNLSAIPCGKPPGLAIDVSLNEANSTSIIQDFLNELQPGDPVFILSFGMFDYAQLNSNARSALAGIGLAFQAPDQWQAGWPIIIQGTKGAVNGAPSVSLPDTLSLIPSDQQLISMKVILTGKREQGTMTSPWIGPALQWGSLKHENLILGSDQINVQVEGQDTAGGVQLLISNAAEVENLSTVSSSAFPKLRLKWTVRDTLNQTAPLHRHWLIDYSPTPEAVALLRSENTVSLPEGRAYPLSVDFSNVSVAEFSDSLILVKYTLKKSNASELIVYDTIVAPLPGQTTNFTKNWETVGLRGDNLLQIEVNPFLLPELDYANNVIQVRIRVDQDQRHPLLDVLADGKKLLQGDLVSPKVEFTIEVRDENPYLALKDTASVDLLHKRPCTGCGFERVEYTAGILEARPGSSGQQLQVFYKPAKLEDGLHTLAIQARDASGNQSGTVPYTISFEVQNESSITHFFPYPNPFSDACRFVFTLTGAEVPDQFMIRIMTVSGRVVREISYAEFGPIRPGHNQSQFVWNGTDQYGDRLANGVYLYKVIARINGNEIKHRSSTADQGFDKGWGKMYILR